MGIERYGDTWEDQEEIRKTREKDILFLKIKQEIINNYNLGLDVLLKKIDILNRGY